MSRKALLKRKPRQIDVEGEPVWIRSLTLGEAIQFDELAKTDQQASLRFLVSRCVTEEDGAPSFADESDPGILDIPTDTLRLIGEAATKQNAERKVASAEKNSDATT